MWQIAWMLDFIPNWFWSMLFYFGIFLLLASYLLKVLPFVSGNRLPLQIIGFIFFSIGLYFQGIFANEEKWQAKIRILEERLALAKEESATTNTVIETKYIERIKEIEGATKFITEYIDREVVRTEEVIKFVENCPIPQKIIETHNMGIDKNINGDEQ